MPSPLLRCSGLAAALVLALSVTPGARADARSFVVFGDSGYIPSYERPDADEPFPRTLGEYLALEVADWLERNPDLTGFKPTPWTFEAALDAWMPASGLHPVARAMDESCRRDGCRFAVMVGDNIYPDGATRGDDGISDARRFEDMLDRPFARLGAGTDGFTIYSMLGNHDWRHSREAALAQQAWLDAHPHFTMPGLFYRAVPEGLDGEVEIFVIDTEMLLASTEVRQDQLDADGNELDTGKLEAFAAHIRPRSDAERRMVAWLGEALASSTARWKLVFGHHALWSGGGSKYEKARALRALLMPALCGHADAYFAGDDHMLEVYSDDCRHHGGHGRAPLPLLVSGAAGKHRPLHPRFMAQQLRNNPELRHHASYGKAWGFMRVTLEDDALALEVYSTPDDLSGRAVLESRHRFERRGAAPR